MDGKAIALGAVAVGGAVLAAGGSASGSGGASSGNQADAGTPSAETTPVSEGGEVVIDNDTGVVYDDAESGSQNDEAGDDTNTSFETINNNETEVDDTDPTTYAPDTEGGSTAPSGGVVSDPGDSQEWGSATEQENDDINDVGELDGDTASAFDRLANYDDPNNL